MSWRTVSFRTPGTGVAPNGGSSRSWPAGVVHVNGTDAARFLGAYLFHPVQWAVVDGWFDPERPQYIIRDRVCHSFCGLDGRVLP